MRRAEIELNAEMMRTMKRDGAVEVRADGCDIVIRLAADVLQGGKRRGKAVTPAAAVDTDDGGKAGE